MTAPTTPATATPAPVHVLVQHLVNARLAQGLSVEDLATALGVTRQAVSAWENSAGSLRLSTLARWSAALGLTVGVAPGPLRVLRRPDGRPARPELRQHTLLTGRGRFEVLAAVLAELPGVPQLSLLFPGEVTDAVRGPRRGTGAVVVVDLAEMSAPGAAQAGTDRAAVVELVSRARSAGVRVVALAEDAEHVDGQLRNNLGLVLHCPGDGTAQVRSAAPGREQTWHVA